MSTDLRAKITQIISDEVHVRKSKVHKIMDKKIWKAVPSDDIGKVAAEAIFSLLEDWVFLPCCHTSGMHDPQHFEKRAGICRDQKAEAFEKLCLDLDINPVTRSRPDCGWCANYPNKRRGEGVRLFSKKEEKKK
jgi:hypothetical protein